MREAEGKFDKFGQPALRQLLFSLGCEVARARSYFFQLFFAINADPVFLSLERLV